MILRGQDSQNIFDRLPSLVKPKANHAHDELDAYLAADVQDISDALKWWHDQHSNYPRLSCMAVDYLSIPGMSHFRSSLYINLLSY